MSMEKLSVDEVKRRARKGPLLLLLRRLFSLFITFLSTVTIARFLSPREFGLAAVSMTIFSFVRLFRDFGLSNAVLRKGFVDQDELSFLFWCNTATTFLLTIVTAIFAGAIASFYHEAMVKSIVLVSLVSFLVGGLTLQHGALLKRNLRFEVSAIIDIVSAVVGFAVGLILAFLFRNVWAIVASNVAQAITTSALNLAYTRWIPSRPKWRHDARELFGFAANSSIFTFVNFFARNTGTIIIGHFLDVATLGLYNRANALFMIPVNNLVQPIAQTSLPVLTRFRGDPDLYRTTYIGLLQNLCLVLVPSSVLLAIGAKPVLVALLGANWAAAGDMLAVMAPVMAVYGLTFAMGDLFISQNRAGELRNSGIWDMLFRAGGAIAGLHWGGLGVAIGLSVGTLLSLPLRLYQAGRRGPVNVRDHLFAMKASIPPALGAAAGGLAGNFISIGIINPVGKAACILMLGGASAMVASQMLRSSRGAMRNLLASLVGRHKV